MGWGQSKWRIGIVAETAILGVVTGWRIHRSSSSRSSKPGARHRVRMLRKAVTEYSARMISRALCFRHNRFAAKHTTGQGEAFAYRMAPRQLANWHRSGSSNPGGAPGVLMENGILIAFIPIYYQGNEIMAAVRQ
jgi:hypothetical protein